MRRVTLTDAQVSTLVRELRRLDLSSEPALQDLLGRLERLADKNDAARYPTPPVEGTQVDPNEKGSDSRTERGRGLKASDSTVWRCNPQDPSSQSLQVAIPMQSVFALDTAGAAARATIKHFESRHPQVHTDVDAEQLEDQGHLDDISFTVKEESEEEVMAEISGMRKRKRRRTTRVE